MINREEFNAIYKEHKNKLSKLDHIAELYGQIDRYNCTIKGLEKIHQFYNMDLHTSLHSSLSIPTLTLDAQLKIRGIIEKDMETQINNTYKEIEEKQNEFSD